MSNLTAFGEMLTARAVPVAGWSFAYNVNADIVATTLTGSGSVTNANNMAVLQTTAAINSSAAIATNRVLRYLPGIGGLLRLTAVFTQGVTGSQQIIGLGDSQNGFFIGFNGASFGIMRRSAGVDNWTLAEQFNRPMPSDFDPTKGNVYQIQFQWLGFGQIIFSFEETSLGLFSPMHTIDYANTAVLTSIRNPALPILAQVANTSNASNMILKTPSAMAFLEGGGEKADPLTFARAFAATKTVTTEVPVLSIRTLGTYQTLPNQIRAFLASLTAATDGNRSVTVNVYDNPALTGASFTSLNTDVSSLQYDVTASAFTGGRLVFSAQLGKIDSKIYDLSRLLIQAAPSRHFTLTALSAASNIIDLSVTVLEEF